MSIRTYGQYGKYGIHPHRLQYDCPVLTDSSLPEQLSNPICKYGKYGKYDKYGKSAMHPNLVLGELGGERVERYFDTPTSEEASGYMYRYIFKQKNKRV